MHRVYLENQIETLFKQRITFKRESTFTKNIEQEEL
jgi:hypothetical protein